MHECVVFRNTYERPLKSLSFPNIVARASSLQPEPTKWQARCLRYDVHRRHRNLGCLRDNYSDGGQESFIPLAALTESDSAMAGFGAPRISCE